ncbi:hypothetical protein [Rhodococcus qingshengii]|nr:hypothetical protein [Rhodococcus qingshengii]WOI90332.1 hypothetical protein R0122_29430 [Rhodococcus qingshengii]
MAGLERYRPGGSVPGTAGLRASAGAAGVDVDDMISFGPRRTTRRPLS